MLTEMADTNKDRKISFTNEEFEKIAQNLIFTKEKYRENIVIPRLLGPVQVKTKEENAIETAFESCAFKSFMSCVIGKKITLIFCINPNLQLYYIDCNFFLYRLWAWCCHRFVFF